jgi:hypothetical protein
MATLKTVLSTTTAFQVHQAALRQGRSDSDYIRTVVERSLNHEAPPLPDAGVDACERTQGNVQVAAYLSGPLAKAVREHARQLDRSQAWTMRDLLRTELRRRGVLPPDNSGHATN